MDSLEAFDAPNPVVALKRAADDAPVPARSGYVLGLTKAGYHRIAYVEWGNPRSERVAICMHGLSRQGRDFDRIAFALAQSGWRVICPDLVGRGRSGWLKDPEDYNLTQYARDLSAVIARTGADKVDWIGTSLGGLVGMTIAGQQRSPIRSLVVNDISPYLPWQALQQLGTAVKNAPRAYDDLEAATKFYSTALSGFGRLTGPQWRHLARYSLTEVEGGTWRALVDPNITASFRTGFFFNLSLWTYWDMIRCPAFVLRGVESTLLTASTLKEMSQRGPKAETVVFPDCGHAPALMDETQIRTVVQWMQSTYSDAAQ